MLQIGEGGETQTRRPKKAKLGRGGGESVGVRAATFKHPKNRQISERILPQTLFSCRPKRAKALQALTVWAAVLFSIYFPSLLILFSDTATKGYSAVLVYDYWIIVKNCIGICSNCNVIFAVKCVIFILVLRHYPLFLFYH